MKISAEKCKISHEKIEVTHARSNSCERAAYKNILFITSGDLGSNEKAEKSTSRSK